MGGGWIMDGGMDEGGMDKWMDGLMMTCMVA